MAGKVHERKHPRLGELVQVSDPTNENVYLGIFRGERDGQAHITSMDSRLLKKMRESIGEFTSEVQFAIDIKQVSFVGDKYRAAAEQAFKRMGLTATAFIPSTEDYPVHGIIGTRVQNPKPVPEFICYWRFEGKTPEEFEAMIYDELTNPPKITDDWRPVKP